MRDYDRFLDIIKHNLATKYHDDPERQMRHFEIIKSKYEHSELFNDPEPETDNDTSYLYGGNSFGDHGFTSLQGIPRDERVDELSKCYDEKPPAFPRRRPVNPINLRGAFGRTKLHEAVLTKDIAGITGIIKRGARTDVKDNAGCTPLMLARYEDDDVMVELLEGLGLH